jgi:hypothetical protein
MFKLAILTSLLLAKTNYILLCKLLVFFNFLSPNLYLFYHKICVLKTPKLALKKWYTTTTRRRGNVAPFPSKTPIKKKTTKIQEPLPHLQI